MSFERKKNSGFSLIELVVVIAILTVLLTITLVAINPSKQFQQANNTKRKADLYSLLSAVGQYTIDHQGQLPAEITTSEQTISNTAADLCSLLTPDYLASLPVDPQTNNGTPIANCSAAYSTNYTIYRTATNRITVAAPAAQNNESISLTR